MPSTRTVFVFPGQGAYRPGILGRLAEQSAAARGVLDEVDAAAARQGVEPLAERVVPDAPDVEVLRAQAPDVLQLAIYGTAVAALALVRERGHEPSAVIGHSLGEVAALVAGGALTPAAGAEVVIHRSAVLAGLAGPRGGMVALGCDTERAQTVLDLVDDPSAAVAAENGPHQTVVSGPAATMETVAAVAAALRVSAVPLPAPYAFHSPLVAAGVAEVSRRLRDVPQQPVTVPVFSPTLGRWVRADDRVGDLVARALVDRVRFARAVGRVVAPGTTVVECGAGGALTRLVQRLQPAVTVGSATDLDPSPVTAAPPAAPVTPDPAPPAAMSVAPPVARPPLTTPPVARPPLTTPPVARPPLTPPPLAAIPTPRPAASVDSGPVAPAPAPGPRLPSERDALFADLRRLYAEALEYPEEVFTEDVALEADLGVDSVKQTELLGRAAERYGLPERPQDFRLSDYDTMGRLVDWIASAGAVSSGVTR